MICFQLWSDSVEVRQVLSTRDVPKPELDPRPESSSPKLQTEHHESLLQQTHFWGRRRGTTKSISRRYAVSSIELGIECYRVRVRPSARQRARLPFFTPVGGSSSGAPAAPPAATRLPRAPSFRRPPSSRRGEALWERVAAGSGSLGAASSESAAGCGRLRGCGC